MDRHPLGAMSCRRSNEWLNRLSPMAGSAANLQAKFLLQVVIRVGRYRGHMGLVGLFSEEPPLFLLVLQEIISGNHSSPAEMLDFG
jgi:hypothetical protein